MLEGFDATWENRKKKGSKRSWRSHLKTNVMSARRACLTWRWDGSNAYSAERAYATHVLRNQSKRKEANVLPAEEIQARSKSQVSWEDRGLAI